MSSLGVLTSFSCRKSQNLISVRVLPRPQMGSLDIPARTAVGLPSLGSARAMRKGTGGAL